MKAFAELYNRLDETTDLTLRVNALVDYLPQAKADDRIWALALLADKRPSRIISLAQIKLWGLEASGLPEWLFEESLKSVGDVVETVSLVIPTTDQVTNESLTFWLKHIESLAKTDDEVKKAGILEAWNLMDANSRFVFTKICTGGFRTTYPQVLLSKAISKYTGRSIPVIADRIISNWNPKKIDFDRLFVEAQEVDQWINPYPFFSAEYLEENPEELGNPDTWAAEYKWDGVRIQLVVRDEKIWLWTKSQELITFKVPELIPLSDKLPNGTVLDGELLGFKDGRPLPLKDIKQRLAKKKPTKKVLKDTPLIFMAYDLLESKGKDVRTLELSKRRSLLEKIINSLVGFANLKLSTMIEFSDWSKVSEILQTARSNQAIGLVLKNKNSAYGIGRGTTDWMKWKVPKLSVKTILLYAQSGGWGGGESNYTFAVWEGENLVPLTKTMIGLSKDEITEINAFVKKNTIEKFGPVRSIKPELVFELIFDTIDKSSRHKCGVVLRNPAILRWHKEDDLQSAHSLDSIKALLNTNE